MTEPGIHFKSAVLIMILLLFGSFAVSSASEKPQTMSPQKLTQLLMTGEETVAITAVNDLVKYPVDSLIQWIMNFRNYPPPDSVGNVVKYVHTISDTLEAPYYAYVPTGYDPTEAAPLMVWLHGGVSRPDFIDGDEDNYVAEHPIVKLCEEHGMILLFPLAKLGCLWWDDTGIANLLWQIRDMKRRFNIDDDRVILGGFSDGASSAFHMAMLAPTDFGMFFSWSGFIAVGSLVGEMPVYLLNMQCRPIFATNGGRDGLYPAEKMATMMRLALEHGSELYFTSYDTAGHNYGYMVHEWPLFGKRITDFRRKALKPSLFWETSDLKYNRLDWLEITAIDTSLDREEWQIDVNYSLINDRVTIGFNHDREWEGGGVKVATVLQDSSLPAFKVKLQPDDIVIGLDDKPVTSIQELVDVKATQKRGDAFSMTIERGEDTLRFETEYPPVSEYDAFIRKTPSGAIQAVRIGNRFEVRTSRVTGFRIKIHPDMIRMDQPVQVALNGEDMAEFVVSPMRGSCSMNF